MWWKTALIAVAAVTVIVILLKTFSYLVFERKVNADIRNILSGDRCRDAGSINAENIASLPEPVQRYARYAEVEGKEHIHTVMLEQTGSLRQSPEGRWMPFKARQYFTVEPPAFVWTARARALPLFPVTARDMYACGSGNMHITMTPFITIADASGAEIDQGSLLRYLGEMVWFPTAYLGDNVRWDPVDSRSARASITCGGQTVSALCLFNEKGQMVEFTAERYREDNGVYTLDTWSAFPGDYRELNTLRVPTHIEIVWKLDTGDFCNFRCEISDLQYNPDIQR